MYQGKSHSCCKRRWRKIIVKRKLGWMYSPDRLEQWLETMEERGYNLYRVSKMGNTFYFIKGSPRKVSYCADYQNFSEESYYDMHRESGWNSVFKSSWSFQKWTIWSQPYAEGACFLSVKINFLAIYLYLTPYSA